MFNPGDIVFVDYNEDFYIGEVWVETNDEGKTRVVHETEGGLIGLLYEPSELIKIGEL